MAPRACAAAAGRRRAEGFGGIQDIFEAFFGGDPFGRRGPAAGGDVGTVLEIELADVLEASKREISFEAVGVCEHCKGNGAEPGTPIETCEKCEGAGELRQVTRERLRPGGARDAVRPLRRRRARSPRRRAGSATEPAAPAMRSWEVDVPAGIDDGQRIRISGAGHAGMSARRQGDLYVEVRIAADERFARQGTELASRIKVPVTTAILGGEMTVPTLEGEERSRSRPGTQHGDIAAAEGPRAAAAARRPARRPARGLRARSCPTDLSDEQREMARAFDATLAERVAARDRGVTR